MKDSFLTKIWTQSSTVIKEFSSVINLSMLQSELSELVEQFWIVKMSTFRSGDTLYYIWKHVGWRRGKIVLFILLKKIQKLER